MSYRSYLLKVWCLIALILIIIVIPCCGLKNAKTETATDTPNISSDNEDNSNSSSFNTDTTNNDYSEPDEDGFIPEDLTGEGREIDYRYMFSGFTPVKLEDREKYDAFDSLGGYGIIWTTDDWFSFMDNYCPGIPYDDFPDFSYECIIYSISFPAKPTYTHKSPVSSVKVYDNGLIIENDETSSSAYYALNRFDICNLAIDILIISKNDLPDNLPDYWFYKE